MRGCIGPYRLVSDSGLRARTLAATAAATLIVTSLLVSSCGDESTSGSPSDGPVLGEGVACDVTFGVTNDVDFRSVQLDVDYHRAPGGFVGEAASVRCSRLVRSAYLVATNQCDPERGCRAGRNRTLRLGLVIGQGVIDAPAGIAKCRFEGKAALRAGDLRVDLREFGVTEPRQSRPVAAVTGIECSETDGTVTTSTTSTTLSDCGEGGCEAGEFCLDGLCVPTSRYEIDFTLTDAVEFGALQLLIAYNWRAGSIVGENVATQCHANPSLHGLAGFNDWVPDGGGVPVPSHESFADAQFAAAIVTGASGERGPVKLFTCLFQSFGAIPSADEFRVWVVDAADITLNPIVPPPTVAVSEVRPLVP